MKASELRLGNLIFSKETQENETMTTISDEYITFNSITFDYPVIEEIKPVPLTEEWLLKFGFKQKGSFYRIKDSRFVEVIIHDKGIDVCNHSICLPHINHVHQLQNLYFALTNEELTIK